MFYIHYITNISINSCLPSSLGDTVRSASHQQLSPVVENNANTALVSSRAAFWPFPAHFLTSQWQLTVVSDLS